MVRDLNTFPSITYRASRGKISKNKENLKQSLNSFDLCYIFRTLQINTIFKGRTPIPFKGTRNTYQDTPYSGP